MQLKQKYHNEDRDEIIPEEQSTINSNKFFTPMVYYCLINGLELRLQNDLMLRTNEIHVPAENIDEQNKQMDVYNKNLPPPSAFTLYLTPEQDMIQKYFDKYTASRPDFAREIHECSLDVIAQFNRDIRIREWQKLEYIFETEKHVMTFDEAFQMLWFNQYRLLGVGSYAFVISKSQFNTKEVFKISFGSEEFHSYDAMSLVEMPFEYCVGLLAGTKHILKPIENSFHPMQLPYILFDHIYETDQYKLQFKEPVSEVYGAHFVPVFEMPHCKPVNLGSFPPDGIKIATIFIEFLRAVDDIHKSGISLVDISPSNVMKCNGQYKFIDLGFCKLYSSGIDYFYGSDNFVFGTLKYRSPWAHVVSEIPNLHNKNLGEKLILELIANDYWGVAMLFIEKLRGFHMSEYKRHRDRVVREIRTSYAIDFAAIEFGMQHKIDACLQKLSPTSASPQLIYLLKGVLQVNPVIRMRNVEKILNHKFSYQ